MTPSLSTIEGVIAKVFGDMGQLSGKLTFIYLRTFKQGHFISSWGRGIQVHTSDKINIKFALIFKSGAVKLSNCYIL